jgi:hypothetical protein
VTSFLSSSLLDACWRHADDEVDRFVLSEEGAVAAPATGQAKKGAQPHAFQQHRGMHNDADHGLMVLATQGDGEEMNNESEPLPLAVVEQPEAAEDCDDGKGEETKGKEKEEKETENERAKNEREDEAETVKKERRRQSHEPQPSRKKSRARSSAPNPMDTAPPSTTTPPSSSSSLPSLHPTPSIDIPRPAPSSQRSAGMTTMPRAASRPSAPPHHNLTPPAALTPLAPEQPLVSLHSPPPLLPSRPLTPSPPKPKKPPRKPVDRTSLHRFSPNKSFVDQFPSAHTLPFD